MSRELLQRTLRALTGEGGPGAYIQSLVADIEKELEKPEHEPFGYISDSMARIALNDGAWDFVNMSRLKLTPCDMPLYTNPLIQRDPDVLSDMYEALKACDEAMSYMSEYDIPIALPEQVKAALAKAEGQP